MESDSDNVQSIESEVQDWELGRYKKEKDA